MLFILFEDNIILCMLTIKSFLLVVIVIKILQFLEYSGYNLFK